MQFIDLEKIKPSIRDLIPALEEARDAVLAEPDPSRRAHLINVYRPRWVALRDAYSTFSNGKCWYVECKNPGTDDDIDHFRPKLGVKEEPTHSGYYWLAFDWKNLRLSCHRANRPRINPEGQGTGGKAGHFPLVNPERRVFDQDSPISNEVPALLDPTDARDVLLLTFRQSGEVDLSPQFRGKPIPEAKISASRLILHLDWPEFREARVVLYNKIARTVDRGEREAPVDCDGMHVASESFMDAVRDLMNAMDKGEEYSSAARVYVESFKHLWWVRDIVLKVAA